MPRQYEGIKKSLERQGLPKKQAQERAAKIYVGAGKSKRARSQRAKSLKD